MMIILVRQDELDGTSFCRSAHLSMDADASLMRKSFAKYLEEVKLSILQRLSAFRLTMRERRSYDVREHLVLCALLKS